MTVSPLAPVVVPVIVGVVTLVMPSVWELPVSLALVSPSDVGTGATVSMITGNALVGLEMLPTKSVSVAVRL